MKYRFCQETDNFTRLLAAIRKVDARGPREAGLLLVVGEPGLGKTRSLEWIATQNSSALVRAQRGWTLNWMLRDISTAIGERVQRRSVDMFQNICASFAATGCMLIVDEIDLVMDRPDILESIRGISDVTEATVIIAGMHGIDKQLKGRPQYYSRIAEICRFERATVTDARQLCDHLCDVEVDDDLVMVLHEQASGFPREIMNGIATIESSARRIGKTSLCLEDLKGVELVKPRK